MKKFFILFIFTFFVFVIPIKAQNFENLKKLQKELDQDYDYYAKADPKNIGAKRLAGKIGILDQGITVLLQKKDKTTFEDVQALTEDLFQETKKYNSEKAKNTQKIAKNILSELQNLSKALGFTTTNTTKIEENSKTNPNNKANENKIKAETKENTNFENKKSVPQTEDTLQQDNSETSSMEDYNENQQPKNKIKIYEEPYQQPVDLSLVYAAIALLFLMILVMWFSLNNAVKKIAHEMRERLKEHDREIESLEKILLSAQLSDSRLTNHKEEVEKRFEAVERSTTLLLMEADKRLSHLENEIKLFDKAKLDLVQFEAFKGTLDNFITREHFERTLNSIQDKIKNTESSLKTSAIIHSVITSKLTHHFEEHKIQLIEALEEFKRKSTHPTLIELIESQLPLLHVAKTLEDCNITAIAKIVQLGFVASYNENLSNAYEKLTNTLRLENLDIEDALIGRMALSDFNAENVTVTEFLTANRFRNADYPNFIAAKYEIENSPLFSTALPNTVIFILYPTVFSARQGSKQLIKKGEYVIKA